MNLDLFLFALAIVAGGVALLVAGYVFLINRREFWKIKDWDKYKRDSKTVEGIQSTIDSKNVEKKNVESSIVVLCDELASARENIRRSDEASKFLDREKVNIARCVALQDQRAKLELEYSAISSNIGAANASIGQLLVQIAELEAKKKHESDHLGEYDKLKQEKENEIAALNELKKQTEEQITGLQEQIKVLAMDIQEKNESLEKVEKSINEAQTVLEKLGTECQKIDQELQARKSLLNDLAEAEKKLKTVNNDCEVAGHKLESLKEAIKGSQKTFDQMVKTAKGTVEIRQDAFKGLYKPVFEKKTTPKQDSETTALAQLETYVDARNFEFPERLLYAFHTALKTSDISCLTVMAGVSGTGKSALPKLYAEAMGMHLCMLSVEPRWDSPRDLFGFFNYMENRYEPTLLARALLQFDPFAEKMGSIDLQDQMLLVLLDEMNLARIEYYFSEYLSKLELRRELFEDIQKDDVAARRKVSMELFSGWKSGHNGKDKAIEDDDEQAIHLYAHTNVLFTGTMNEDETTQSLSDKVIDRANVLHFGRPSRLQDNQRNVHGQHATLDKNVFVSAKDWRDNWCKNPATVNLDNYRARLDELNKVLGNVNRPFAHRTSKAILAYVANYPLENARDRAFADQVAMRIMPKLRGLDLGMFQNELLAVQGQIQQINDLALNDAFERARSNNTHGFFRWQGIDWSR